MQFLDDAEYLIHDNRGKAHRGLIQHHELGVGHQGPGHGQHLLLAAGQGACHLLTPLLQAGEIVEDHFQILLRNGLVDVCTHLQIFLNGHLQKDAASLRHMGQARTQQLIGLRVGDVLAAEGNGSRPGVHQAGDSLQDGALARAVGADQGHDFPVANLERHVFHRVNGAVVYVNILNLQHLHHPPPCLSRPQ